MVTVEGFEDLKVWKEARLLNMDIILTNDMCSDHALKSQVNRSPGSIMDNIAEGFERQGNKAFKQFLTISRGSCGEVKSQLSHAWDRNHIDLPIFEKLMNRAKDISKMLNSFIKYLKNSDLKGSKYAEEPLESNNLALRTSNLERRTIRI